MPIDRTKFPHMATHDEIHEREMQDPEFRAAYEALGPRYEVINRVIGARLARGWTQTDLARAVGTSQSSIARLESGEHDPRWTTVVRVCQALEIPIALGGIDVA